LTAVFGSEPRSMHRLLGCVLAFLICSALVVAGAAADSDICDESTSDGAIAKCNFAIGTGKANDRQLAVAFSNRGDAAYEKGHHDRAIIDYGMAIRLDRTFASAFVRRGNAYQAKGDLDRAIADFGEAIRLDPKHVFQVIDRGNAYFAKRDLIHAIADYDQVIRLDPTYALAFIDRGNAYFAKGDRDRATADYDEAIRLDPKNSVAYNQRGSCDYAKGDMDRAIADFGEAIRLDPKLVVALNNRGNAYVAKGDMDHAIADYGEVIRLEPKYDAALYSRANAYFAKRDYDRAMADYDEAIRHDPRNAAARSNRGYIYYWKRDYERAIADLDLAIALNPQNAFAYANRGSAYSKKGDYDRAIADLNRAIRLNPQNVAALTARGLAYSGKRDFDLALQDFDEAIHINPRYATAWAGRAAAREGKGEIKAANRDMVEALALDPDAALATEMQGMRERLNAALAKEQAATVAPAPGTTSPVAAAAGPPAPAVSEKRVALVIGNSAYRAVAPLFNPRHDADALAGMLRNIGFRTVQLELDIGRERMADVLGSFAREADDADWALVYYAGHGIEMGGVNYLIPVDATLETDRDVEFQAVPLDRVMTAVEGARKLRLVLLDACRNNPFAAEMRRTLASRSIGRGLARVEPATGTLVVFAAKHGEVALDGDDANSPFAAALLRELPVPGLEARRMFDVVRDDVLEATNSRQQPFSYGSVPGRQDFYFVAAPPRPAAITRADVVKLFEPFRQILTRVQSDYVEATDERQLLQAAIAAMRTEFPTAQKVSSTAPPQPLPLIAAVSNAPPAGAAGKPDLNDLYDAAAQILDATMSGRDEARLIDAAIDGLLSALDGHSSYMSAQTYRDMQMQSSGEFGGLGIEFTMDQGLPKVVTAIDDTPAAKAGVRSNDVISHIDGAPTQGLLLPRVAAKMRGPVGTAARLTIVRAGEDAPLDLSMIRELIRTRSVRSRVEGDDIGYIRITQFNQQTTEAVKKAVAATTAQVGDGRLKGYVLDLRNNAGGLLDQVVSVADGFLDQGDIVSMRSRKPEQRFTAKPGDILNGKPTIVLINGGTASGSEIVAGALHDNKRAKLVGTRSFGNGSVQTIIPLGAGQGALRLTTSRFFTPVGSAIHSVGIAPDIEVLQDVPDQKKATSEARGEWFAHSHLPGEGKPHGSQSYVPPDPSADKALQKALQLLRTGT
jgi:C-terminal peptidase prc